VHITVHNTAQSSSDNFPSYAPQNRHTSDDIFWRGGQTHRVKGVTDNHFPGQTFPGQDVSWTRHFPDNHFRGQDVSRKDVSRTSACPDSAIISRTRRFPNNRFRGQTFHGQFIQIFWILWNVHVARYAGLIAPPHKVISTLLSLRCLTAHWSKP